MRKESVREQVYQILTYVQKKTADIWKKNILANLELENWKFLSVEELLVVLKKEFERGDNKQAKIAEFKQLKQDSYTINKFVQIFRKVARESKYKKRTLVEKFEREINSTIRCKCIKIKQSLLNIDK